LVKHSPRLQEQAWTFAKNLDIAHKIWSELNEFKQNNSLLNRSDTLINAIYKDKYSDKYAIEENEMNELNNKSYIRLKSAQILSSFYSSTIADSTSNEQQQQQQSSNINIQSLNEFVLNDCKDLLNTHYELAMKSLSQLENENSELEAIISLKSILNVIKNTV
jgi:hypothetical protein